VSLNLAHSVHLDLCYDSADSRRAPLRNTGRFRGVSSCSSLGWPAEWQHLYLGRGKNSGNPNAWLTWVSGVIWHQLCDATLWIQELCNLATLHGVSLGGYRGHSSYKGRGPWPPLKTATETAGLNVFLYIYRPFCIGCLWHLLFRCSAGLFLSSPGRGGGGEVKRVTWSMQNFLIVFSQALQENTAKQVRKSELLRFASWTPI